METGSVPVGPVLEEVDKRVLAVTAGTTEVDETSEELYDRRCCCGHGPKCSSWIVDHGKGNEDFPGQERICTCCTVEDKDRAVGAAHIQALPATRSTVIYDLMINFGFFWFGNCSPYLHN